MNPYHRVLEDFEITLMDTLAPGTLAQTEITFLPPGLSPLPAPCWDSVALRGARTHGILGGLRVHLFAYRSTRR